MATRMLPIYRFGRHGRKFRAHNSACASGFRTDRRTGAIYPSFNVEGEIMPVERASIECDFCAYCLTGAA